MKDVIEHKFKFHEDDRGQRFQDVYGDNMPGSQINVGSRGSFFNVICLAFDVSSTSICWFHAGSMSEPFGVLLEYLLAKIAFS